MRIETIKCDVCGQLDYEGQLLTAMIGLALAGMAVSVYLIAREYFKCFICDEWHLSCRMTPWGQRRDIVPACSECREMRVLVRPVVEEYYEN